MRQNDLEREKNPEVRQNNLSVPLIRPTRDGYLGMIIPWQMIFSRERLGDAPLCAWVILLLIPYYCLGGGFTTYWLQLIARYEDGIGASKHLHIYSHVIRSER